MQTDVLIIGQGICGTFLSWWLEKAGLSWLMIDEQRPFTASKAAAGLINPVTGRRIVKTWMIDELLPFAQDAYRRIGEELGATFVEQKSLVDFFPTPQMRLAFLDRYTEDPQYLQLPENERAWDEYFRYDRNSNGNFSSLRYIFSNPALRWAFSLLLVLLTLIYVFDSKRKQRILPLIAGLRNNSLDFVKTIGRLYYQRRDNKNLAWKMSAHFQDHVRTRYNITVALSDPDFIERLSYKTGMGISFIRELTGEIQRLQDSPRVTDEELLQFNQKMEEFYKHV